MSGKFNFIKNLEKTFKLSLNNVKYDIYYIYLLYYIYYIYLLYLLFRYNFFVYVYIS